jgi:hypothetical protein
MQRKISTLTALAVLTAAVSSPMPGVSQTGVSAEVCEFYETMDRSTLQQELSRLLETDPNNGCIDYLVSLLGGSPVAEVVPTDPY